MFKQVIDFTNVKWAIAKSKFILSCLMQPPYYINIFEVKWNQCIGTLFFVMLFRSIAV